MTQLALFGGPKTVTERTGFAWPPIDDSDVAAVSALLARGEISYYGREGVVAELEDAFAAYHGMAHALTCSSGTAALHSAYFALGLEPGDEVIAPSFTFLSTVMPLFTLNAVPVLVDSEPGTGNIDPAAIEAAVTERTRAIVVVHLNGHPCDMAPIMAVAKARGLRVVEDCSHAHGATYRDTLVGRFGDMAVWSLQGSKLVAAGQGGILLTDDTPLFERAVLFGHFRNRSFDDVRSAEYRPFATTGYGLNYRMHPLAAALALRQFGRLDTYIEGRNANLGPLSEGLPGACGIRPAARADYATRHPWYAYKPLYDAGALDGLPRATYLAAMRAEGVPIDNSTSLPLHLEPLFATRDDRSISYGREANRRVYRPGDLPVSEGYAEASLRIPPYTDPCPRLIEQIVEAAVKVGRAAGALHDYARTGA